MGWAVSLSALLLVVLWTLPALGLLVTSLRDRDQIVTTGWWRALAPAETTRFVRTGTAPHWQDGRQVIAGSVLDAGQELVAWGLRADAPAAFRPGDSAPTVNGWQMTVAADGSYLMTGGGGLERGVRVFVTLRAPPDLTLANYDRVLTAGGLARSFANTAMVTAPATVIPILMAALAAYALAWMAFPGRTLLTAAVICLMVVPLQVALIPLLRLHHDLGIGKGYLGIWLAHTGFGLPLAIFVLRNHMARLPAAVIESARLDGASEMQIFRQITLPLSFPALAAFAIFQFMWVWNDLLVASVFLGSKPDQMVLTVHLRQLMGAQGGEWHVLAASAFVTMAVPLAVFFALQKYLLRGMLDGSVRGV